MPYETAPRKRRPSWDAQEAHSIQRLPIKLSNGQIKETGRKAAPSAPAQEETDESDSDGAEPLQETRREDVATGARFGRLAVVDVIGTSSRKARIQAAQDQIAGICQDIVSDPENGVRCREGFIAAILTCLLARTYEAPAYIFPPQIINSQPS